MYRRERGNDMKRIYDVPPSYSGSRFIRATHGVRALSDAELSPPSAKERSRASANMGATAGRTGARPDFEYFGNAISPSDKTSDRASSGKRYPSEDDNRGDPLPVDRYAHDLDRSPAELLPSGDSPSASPPDPDALSHASLSGSEAHLAYPGRLGVRPHRAKTGKASARRAPGDRRKDAGDAHDLSAEDGDLLLLALLALLAGEGDCADVVAALALLLAVR